VGSDLQHRGGGSTEYDVAHDGIGVDGEQSVDQEASAGIIVAAVSEHFCQSSS